MKHLLKHLPEVCRRLQGFGRVLLGLDYDGTLTPIRPAPELAVLSPSGYEILSRLQQKPAVILMILSGRSLQDIKAKVPLPQVWFGGSHGLELEGPGHRFVHPEALSFKAILPRIQGELSPWVNIFPGLRLEPKPYSLAVHYRQVSALMLPDLKRSFHNWRRTYKNVAECLPGKKVWELKPRIAWDKGKAFRYIMDYESRRQPARGCYPVFAGDDRTDESVFISLGPQGLSIRIAAAPVSSKAEFYLKNTAEMEDWLKILAEWVS